FSMNNANHNETKFIYAGGISHLNDLKLINNIINGFANKFFLAGYNFNNPKNVEIRSLFNEKINLISNLPLHSYMKCYNKANVSLVPLVNNEFNNCKSQLKTIEAGCKGLHVI